MIGVVADVSERDVVEEFFELFKTPWERFRPGYAYDVVIATTPDVPDVDARLLIISGSRTSSMDSVYGITAVRKIRTALLEDNKGVTVPTFGQTLELAAPSGVNCVSTRDGSAGVMFRCGDRRVVRLGYDLFQEIRYLLSTGQSVQYA